MCSHIPTTCPDFMFLDFCTDGKHDVHIELRLFITQVLGIRIKSIYFMQPLKQHNYFNNSLTKIILTFNNGGFSNKNVTDPISGLHRLQ